MCNCSQKVSAFILAIGLTTIGFAKSEHNEPRVETKAIPPQVQYEFSRSVGPGRVLKVRDGVPGTVTRVYSVKFVNGKPVSKELVKEERVEPVNALFHMGRQGYSNSRGAYTRSRVLTMHASAYDPSPATIGPGATGLTKMGIPAGFGVVAVDPRVIPLGTRVFVEGYGYAIAADIGSAIKGNRIDLCFERRSTAIQFGRRTVRVHVLSSR